MAISLVSLIRQEDMFGVNETNTTQDFVSVHHLFQSAQQRVPSRLLLEKGIFTGEKFLEMVRVVDREIKRKPNGIK